MLYETSLRIGGDKNGINAGTGGGAFVSSGLLYHSFSTEKVMRGRTRRIPLPAEDVIFLPKMRLTPAKGRLSGFFQPPGYAGLAIRNKKEIE